MAPSQWLRDEYFFCYCRCLERGADSGQKRIFTHLIDLTFFAMENVYNYGRSLTK